MEFLLCADRFSRTGGRLKLGNVNVNLLIVTLKER